MSSSPDIPAVKTFLLALQARIVQRLEQLDGNSFARDQWERPAGGGGISRVLEDSVVFERAGVMFSHVFGDGLPASASASRPNVAGKAFEAMGVSLVIHPRNPYVPTVHLNVRFFSTKATATEPAIWWFGGGMDLTPFYGFEKDAARFHGACKEALDAFGPEYHPQYKRWCDEYFYLKHRQEARGVGGVFFDDLNEPGFETSFALTRSIGDAFLQAYPEIVERRKGQEYTDRERQFQLYRRGRYVEFNLVFDRGTLFGLQSGGRTEAILVSMPPLANWRYDWQPEPDSPEATLYTDFLPHRDWV